MVLICFVYVCFNCFKLKMLFNVFWLEFKECFPSMDIRIWRSIYGDPYIELHLWVSIYGYPYTYAWLASRWWPRHRPPWWPCHKQLPCCSGIDSIHGGPGIDSIHDGPGLVRSEMAPASSDLRWPQPNPILGGSSPYHPPYLFLNDRSRKTND